MKKYIAIKIKYNNNWIKLFGIYNTKNYLIFYFFEIIFALKMNEERAITCFVDTNYKMER